MLDINTTDLIVDTTVVTAGAANLVGRYALHSFDLYVHTLIGVFTLGLLIWRTVLYIKRYLKQKNN